MSFSVGQNKQNVLLNRKAFFRELGISIENVAYQKQVHQDRILVAKKGGLIGESDAMITSVWNTGLAISTADCNTIFIYDKKEKFIVGIHSGWRGTVKKIVKKTLTYMIDSFNSKPKNLFIFLAPSISQKNYDVGSEVADQFSDKYIMRKNNKLFLDISQVNYDMITEFNIPKNQIEKSELCSYDTDYLHSYRRDGEISGRALGVIAMKKIEK
jgi:YfiH family protein